LGNLDEARKNPPCPPFKKGGKLEGILAIKYNIMLCVSENQKLSTN
jgi:hypothetical protein